MKIALVTESFLPQVNGVTNSVLRILEHLSAKGMEAIVIAPESINGPHSYAGFRVKRVPSLAMKGLIPIALPHKTLEPLLEGFSPDVIHLASPIFLGSSVAKIAKRMQIPTVSIYQTDVAGFARHYGLTIAHSQLKKWIAKIHIRTDRTLAPSTWACRDLEESGVKNVHLWQRGVDSTRFNPLHRNELWREQFQSAGSPKFIVGYVGRLANEKRVDELRILDQQEDIQLVIVGDGPARKKLEKALPNAHFTGYKSGEELSMIYASIDLFVHTGKHETFCQSVQEALASGTPVIAPNSGGPIDLVENQRSGYLIDTSDSELLLKTVLAVKSDVNLAQMSRHARKSVIGRTWQGVNDELLAHYEELIRLYRREPQQDRAQVA
ncbi:MAG: glycosyltransferase family 1 protein [Actinomycetota bacterium]